MRNFKKGSGRSDFGRGRSDRSESSFGGERKTMHSAVCGECGDSCQVPFKPRGDKPVYCSHCFGQQESASNSNFSKPREFKRETPVVSNDNKELIKKISDLISKLDQVIDVLMPKLEVSEPVANVKKEVKTKKVVKTKK
jgi:CxxC-x17-CxxC domain-containing protein